LLSKGAFYFLQGYGQSSANPDDYSGRAHRECNATWDLFDTSDVSLENLRPAEAPLKRQKQQTRMNLPMPSWRTMQRRKWDEENGMKSADLHLHNIRQHAMRITKGTKKGSLWFTVLPRSWNTKLS
jgi:hypothetical protein